LTTTAFSSRTWALGIAALMALTACSGSDGGSGAAGQLEDKGLTKNQAQCAAVALEQAFEGDELDQAIDLVGSSDAGDRDFSGAEATALAEAAACSVQGIDKDLSSSDGGELGPDRDEPAPGNTD
jgi:hypothetical protein